MLCALRMAACKLHVWPEMKVRCSNGLDERVDVLRELDRLCRLQFSSDCSIVYRGCHRNALKLRLGRESST